MGVVVKRCPFCDAKLEGGSRSNTDGAGEFFYYHPHNGCVVQAIGVWPHNIEAWNTRAPSSFELDRQCRREIEGRENERS